MNFLREMFVRFEFRSLIILLNWVGYYDLWGKKETINWNFIESDDGFV